MAVHARQQIMTELVNLLKVNKVSYRTVINDRIPAARTIWPYLMLYIDTESSIKDVVNKVGNYQRIIVIVITGMLKAAAGDKNLVEAEMASIAEEIEKKLTYTAIQAVLPLVKSLSLTDTSMEVVVDDAEKPDHAEVTVLCEVSYATAEGVPGTFI